MDYCQIIRYEINYISGIVETGWEALLPRTIVQNLTNPPQHMMK